MQLFTLVSFIVIEIKSYYYKRNITKNFNTILLVVLNIIK